MWFFLNLYLQQVLAYRAARRRRVVLVVPRTRRDPGAGHRAVLAWRRAALAAFGSLVAAGLPLMLTMVGLVQHSLSGRFECSWQA